MVIVLIWATAVFYTAVAFPLAAGVLGVAVLVFYARIAWRRGEKLGALVLLLVSLWFLIMSVFAQCSAASGVLQTSGRVW
jgi:hypothetical protein